MSSRSLQPAHALDSRFPPSPSCDLFVTIDLPTFSRSWMLAKPRMAQGLNPAQADAVATVAGPLLVLAGAGTGKTRVVTFRIAELIRRKTRPSRILGVTFTNKAAAEMQERIAGLLGKQKDDRPEISTFHSLCVRILRRNAKRLGYPEQFAIYDAGDQESLARQSLREIRVPGEVLSPGDLMAKISHWKSAGLSSEEANQLASSDKDHLAAMAYKRYQKSLKAMGAVDFDDLLLLTEELFEEHPEARRAEAGRFDHLLVDEYQDTNHTQYAIVKALAGGHRNLCVVGDDDQSIYGWRGADVRHILSFRKDWPEAKVVRLEENYRSTEAILEIANRVIRYNADRYDKTLRAARLGGERPRIEQFEDEEIEAEQTIADIRQRLTEPGREPRDFAILFRTNEQTRAFEQALRKHKVPYVLIGGMSFFDRKEVKDIISYLRLIDGNCDDVSLLRVINRPARGISQGTVESLQAAAVKEGHTLWQTMADGARVGQVASKGAEAVRKFVELIQRYQKRIADGALAASVRALLAEIDYEEELRRIYPEAEDQAARWGIVEEMINSLASYEEHSRGKAKLNKFLDEVLLGERDTKDEKDEQLKRNAVVLMTLHSAKGLEFPIVYMVGMEEGILPHHRSIAAESEQSLAEERRLCYVGITRAQDRLTFSLSLSRRKWGRPRPTIPSRFLFEVMGQADKAPAAAGIKAKPIERPRGKAARRK